MVVENKTRKNYSIDSGLVKYLFTESQTLEKKVGRYVPRQIILDHLIILMRTDKEVREKLENLVVKKLCQTKK